MIARFTYPKSALFADYARAAAGLIFVGLVILLPLHWAVAVAFVTIAALLASLGVRTAIRHASRIELSDDGIALRGPIDRVIAWSELNGLALRYFSMRRDRKHGWMELRLQGGGRRLGIESQIQGFNEIVERAADAAGKRGLALDAATETNLAAMGVVYTKSRIIERGDSHPVR
jgi:hypothetical protein